MIITDLQHQKRIITVIKLINDSKSQIAKRYALALYMAAEEKGKLDHVQKDIDTLLEVIHANSSIVTDLSNPLLSVDDKQNALCTIAKKLKLTNETLRCLDIVVSNNRTKNIEAILEGFREVYLKKHNIISVQVNTVKALSTAQDKKLREKLEKKLNSKVLLKYKIDPTVLGGLVICYQSNMIDDSIQGKLNKLSSIMKGA